MRTCSYLPVKISWLSCFMLALVSSAEEACVGSKACGKQSEQSSVDESSLVQLQMNVDSTKKNIDIKSFRKEESQGKSNATSNATGPTTNTAGDLSVFISGIKSNLVLMVVYLCLFMVFKRYYPSMYEFRATGAYGQEKTAPITWDVGDSEWFKWVKVSYRTTLEMMIETCGLDSALHQQFFVMSMEILAGIIIPNLLICSTLYCFCGYDYAGDDYLSYLGINNVDPSRAQWIYWVVGVMTWYNVVFIQYRLFQWQRFFIKLRNEWLEAMPQPRDSTLLVEGIDDEVCSDGELKKFMEMLYGQGEILEAFVVKKIPALEALVEEYKGVDQNLHEVEYFIEKNPNKPKPTFRIGGGDEQQFYTNEKKRLTDAIKAEQARIAAEGRKKPEDTDIYSYNGFVTFKDKSKCVQAIMTRVRADAGSFVFSVPPDPSDVIYHDLSMPLAKQEFLQMIGYALVALLALFYLPIVSLISKYSAPSKLKTLGFFAWLFDTIPAIEGIVASLAPSMGLTIMVCFLPTFLLLIFQSFYYLKANRWAQLELQVYYYWFCVIFVLLVTCIGGDLTGTVVSVAESPLSIFTIVGDKMPYVSHFYMNYATLQWSTNAMSLMRYVNLGKYMIFSRFCDPERARQLSEPEDQDYYGMGSRMARNNLMMIMGLIYGSTSPLVSICCFFYMAFSRIFFGYLIPYQETRKDDLGGAHWALQLHQIHYGILFYIILQVGLLVERADSHGPAIIATATFIWWYISLHKYDTKLQWENLSFEEVVKTQGQTLKKRKPTRLTYKQPELDADIFKQLEIK